MDRMHLLRVALNLEQLLYRAPGGTGRYAARLAALLAHKPTDDVVIPFTAWHRRGEIVQAYRNFGLSLEDVAYPVVLRLPRAILFDAWHVLGIPPLDKMSRTVAGADVIHAPSPAVPAPGKVPLVVT